jgi:hypothetical protein
MSTHPIISGDEIVIPLTWGDLVTNAPKDERPQFFARALAPPVRAPHVPAARPLPVFQPAPAVAADIDVWAAITRLNWVDRDDDQYPTLNPRRPSQKWTQAEWQSVQKCARPLYDRMCTYLENQNFWFKNGIPDADKPAFVWHCIARGRQIYDAVMSDSNFACGYIGQACGFMQFMTNWS